ncbi:MAG: hypothetical protein M0P73_01350 [Syntrophobacterales bacterium]|jgi:hypothetical protein|nr:hypothetical protein [Syntrophobacterales bacterium]
MSSDKKVPQPSKRTATPPDLAKALQDAYAEKYPHLPPLENHMKDLEDQKEREALKDKNRH